MKPKKFIEFTSDEQQVIVDEIDKIITSLNEIKSNYIKTFKEKSDFINKLLDFILTTYKIFFKECDYDISELSMNNCRLIEGITNTFHNIEYVPKALNFCEKVMKEVEKRLIIKNYWILNINLILIILIIFLIKS